MKQLTLNGSGNGAGNGHRAHRVVSLFSGCGGMDLGFTGGFSVFGQHYERLPFEVVWANDLSAAACLTYERNLGHVIHCGDIWKAMDQLPRRADVVIGGFPCQDISINGKQAGVGGARSGLYRAMVEVIGRLKPRAFVAENVKGLFLKSNRESLSRLLADFGSLGYSLSLADYRAVDYGVPQRRERVFIVGTAVGTKPFRPPRPTRKRGDWLTSKAAIGDLETVAERDDINHIWSRAERSPEQGDRTIKADQPSETIRAECHGNIQWHYALPRRLSMREAARLQSFPDNFIFAAKLRETERQIGNAVPPVLAWHIGNELRDALND